jgi:leucyl aminopeptidase
VKVNLAPLTALDDAVALDCLIVFCQESKGVLVLGETAKVLRKQVPKPFADIAETKDFLGKVGTALPLLFHPWTMTKRVLLVGIGTARMPTVAALSKTLTSAVKVLRTLNVSTIGVALDFGAAGAEHDATTPSRLARCCVEVIKHGAYRFNMNKTKQGSSPPWQELRLFVDASCINRETREAVAIGSAIANAMALTCDLGNLPPNVATPTYIARQAEAIAKTMGMRSTILEQTALKKVGMNAFLAVARGLWSIVVERNENLQSCWSAKGSRSILAASPSSRQTRWTK